MRHRESQQKGARLATAIRPRIAVLALAILTVGAVYAPSAAQATGANWDFNGVPTEKAVAVISEGTITISDTLDEPFECKITSEGNLGVSGGGEITHVTLSGCSDKKCESPPEAVADDLPWHLTLSDSVSERTIRDSISEDGKGIPGFTLSCKYYVLGNINNVCKGNMSVAVRTITGGIDQAFDGNTEKLSCGIKNSQTGKLEGTQFFGNPSSGTIAAGPEIGEWTVEALGLSSPVAVATKGTLTVNDPNFVGENSNSPFECSSTGETQVGAGGGGEIKKLTVSGCKARLCESELEVTAQHLPWRILLRTSEGATRDLVTEGGSGTPGFKLKCKVEDGLGKWEAICTGNTSSLTQRVTGGGVDETFEAGSEKLKCGTEKTASGTIAGTQLFESPASGKLRFEPGLL